MKVLHGTSSVRAKLMRVHGVAFVPLFVTTDRVAAIHYAKARTAADLEVGMACVPVVISMEVHDNFVEKDDYNEDAEPNQYKIHKPNMFLKNSLVENFAEGWPPEKLELMRLQAFAFGMSRYLEEDREVTPLGRRLLHVS